MIGRGRAPHDSSGRGADNDVGYVVRNARTAQTARKSEQPGNEVFTAAAEHEGAVLAFSERRSSGNWHGRKSIDVDVRLRAA